MTEDWEYREETIIGHHVAAREKPKSNRSKHVDEWLDQTAERLGVERQYTSPRIEIEVGDVDWDDTKSVTVRLDVLRDIVETFDDNNGVRESDVRELIEDWRNNTSWTADETEQEILFKCANELEELIEE